MFHSSNNSSQFAPLLVRMVSEHLAGKHSRMAGLVVVEAQQARIFDF
jgi:hypothetical protein